LLKPLPTKEERAINPTLKLIIIILSSLILSLKPTANHEEQFTRLASYGSIIGTTVINHHLYIGADKNDMDALEPLFAAFSDRLFGLETEFGKVTVRYDGALDDIDTDDFSDINLSWNGDPLEFNFYAVRKIQHGYGQEFVTDIYLDITVNYEKPGVYSFSAKYQGVPFNLYVEVNVERTAGVAADPADLRQLSVTYLPVDEFGMVNPKDLRAALKENTVRNAGRRER